VNFSEVFIRRPVATTLIMLAIILFGVVAYRSLPISDLPNVDFPTIRVDAGLPGASPETMAASVATPLERQFSTIAGIDSMTSSSALGSTSITIQFTLTRNLDAAAQDVQAAIAAATRQLPPNMPSPPTYRKVNPADSPILYLSLASTTLPLSTLDEFGQTMMAQRISTVQGVAQVQVYGSQKYAVRIQLDPRELAARGIGIDEVATAVRNGNVNLPTGTLYGRHQSFTVEADGQLTRAEAYEPLIVTYRNGAPVRIRDIGRSIDSVESDKTAAWNVTAKGAARTITLAIQKQPGTNTVQIVDRIRALMPSFQKQLPAAATLRVRFDRSIAIRESVADVKFTLVLTLALVVMVIFLFLRNLSATVIPSLALPLSIVGTFAVMFLLGFSLDNLSLMALTLSVGFVVDDAIVMLENIVRHMEKGEKPLEAALRGSREIGFTIISMTISLAAVFIPVLFMGGIVGRLFHEFAVTIGVAILISGFVSLSLTPMLCSRFLRPGGHGERHGKVYNALENVFDASLRWYENTLRWTLARRRATMVFSAVILALTAWLFVKMPKGFLPSEDIGQVFGFTEGAQGISFPAMSEKQAQIAEIMAKNPNVDAVMSNVGGRDNSNQGIVFATLKPRHERNQGPDEIIQELRPQFAKILGIRVFLQNPPPIRIGGSLSKSQYQFTLQGADTSELYEWAPKLEEKLRALPGLQDVTSDLQLKNPQVKVGIDRDRAATLGVTPARIEDALYTAYGSRQISTIYAPNNQYQVIMEVAPEHQLDPSSLSSLYVRSEAGTLVPLSGLATFTQDVGPMTVTHLGQLPSVTLSFNLRPGLSLGEAVGQVEKVARATLPATISTSFQGTAQAFQDSTRGLGILLIVAILVIYMVLGILYESFIHPLTILSALPFAGFGALVTLLVFGVEISIYAFVGIILLVGLVKKNGIMMVDFAIEAQRNEGKNAEEAIFEACVVRFRPIMMTTMAALMGTLPIALGYGAGAESRRPLGLAVVGGLLFSQMLTLYVTPVFYIYMDRLQQKVGRKRGPRRGEPATAPAPSEETPESIPATAALRLRDV
jgi:hydrophobic/amphiphilic exporter-1 (mainly G- bacteria), HAE1 family